MQENDAFIHNHIFVISGAGLIHFYQQSGSLGPIDRDAEGSVATMPSSANARPRLLDESEVKAFVDFDDQPQCFAFTEGGDGLLYAGGVYLQDKPTYPVIYDDEGFSGVRDDFFHLGHDLPIYFNSTEQALHALLDCHVTPMAVDLVGDRAFSEVQRDARGIFSLYTADYILPELGDATDNDQSFNVEDTAAHAITVNDFFNQFQQPKVDTSQQWPGQPDDLADNDH